MKIDVYKVEYLIDFVLTDELVKIKGWKEQLKQFKQFDLIEKQTADKMFDNTLIRILKEQGVIRPLSITLDNGKIAEVTKNYDLDDNKFWNGLFNDVFGKRFNDETKKALKRADRMFFLFTSVVFFGVAFIYPMLTTESLPLWSKVIYVATTALVIGVDFAFYKYIDYLKLS